MAYPIRMANMPIDAERSIPVSAGEGELLASAADAALDAVRAVGINADGILLVIAEGQTVTAALSSFLTDPMPFIRAASRLLRDDRLEHWRRSAPLKDVS